MKIVLLHHAAHPVVGGVENVVREHSRLMRRAGHDVLIIAGRGAQVDPGVRFVSVPLVDSVAPRVLAVKSALDAGRVPREFAGLSLEIEARIRELIDGADWLIAHNVCSLNKNLALTDALRRLESSAAKPRFMLWHHDLAWTTPRYRDELHDGIPWSLLRMDWPSAVQVTISESRRRELAELLGVPGGRINVIPNGIDAARFLGLSEPTVTLVRKLDLMQADPLLLLPVRITPRKNIEKAIQITGILRERFPQAKLAITGPAGAHNHANAAYAESLLKLRASLNLDEAVVFVTLAAGGDLPDHVVAELYRLASALLLPSKEEGFGIPILEAGLAGIPVICSDIGPLQELAGTEAQYFAADGDARRAAGLIESAVSNSGPTVLKRRVIREYEWQRIYDSHLAPLLSRA